MILDLRLPAGWTQATLGQAVADPAASASPGTASAPAAGWLYRPPPDRAEAPQGGEAAAGLLLSPLLPLLRSPTLLLQAALDSEPDYEVTHESPFISARLGPWEATLLETEGQSRETGVVSARIYAVLDVGHGAFMLVFVDCDPGRMDLRREQLADLLAQARLRTAAQPTPTEVGDAPDADLGPSAEPPRADYTLDAGLSLEEDAPTSADPDSPATEDAAPLSRASELRERSALPAPPADERSGEEDALPTPPQRPAEDVYLGGMLFPHLID
jgi:hypothetical protein